MSEACRVLLIGGPSHAGKSTLARTVAKALGWQLVSTDHLGRHPGRPWGRVPAPVVDHYLTLSDEELIAAYLDHYQRMWPMLERLITAHATDPSLDRLVLEGSGVRPEGVAGLGLDAVAAVWLIGGNDLLEGRIIAASGYADAPPRDRSLIEKFVSRTLNDRDATEESAATHGLRSIRVNADTSVAGLVAACLAATNAPATE